MLHAPDGVEAGEVVLAALGDRGWLAAAVSVNEGNSQLATLGVRDKLVILADCDNAGDELGGLVKEVDGIRVQLADEVVAVAATAVFDGVTE